MRTFGRRIVADRTFSFTLGEHRMKLRIIAAGSAALLAAACGGSKSSTPSTPPAAHDVSYTGPTGNVAITGSAQAATVASGAFASIQAVGGASSFAGGLPAVSAAPALDVLGAARAADRAAPQLAAAQVAGATQSGSQPCQVSGTMSGTVTAVDTNSPFTHSGDSASITFRLCNDGSGELIDGTVSIRVDATVAGTDPLSAAAANLQTDFAYALTLTFSDLTVANLNNQWTGMDGNITLGLKRTTSPYYDLEQSISGTGLAYATGQGAQVLGGSLLTGPNGTDRYLQQLVTRFTDGTFVTELAELGTINGKVCSREMGGCLSTVTVTPIYDPYGSTNPTDGLLVLRSGNAELVFDVVSATSVDIGYDNDVTVDPTPLGTLHATWACLQANNCPAN